MKEKKATEDFWVKGGTAFVLLRLIGYIWYEAPAEEHELFYSFGTYQCQ